MKRDVLILADIFEKCVNWPLKIYKLTPSHYFSSPELTWDAVLKMTEVNLELISNIDLHYFIEKEMRGGISYICNRFSEANSEKCISYLDENNLYGWAMSQYHSYWRFKFLNQKKIEDFDVNSIGEKRSKGYILEVHLEYPDKIHYLHNDYTLAPEKIEVS